MRTTNIILFLIINLCSGLKVNAFQNAQGVNSSNSSRQVIPFNQDWQFKKATYKTNIAIAGNEWESITVPHTWNNKDIQKGKNFYTGDAFYRKNLVAREEWKDKRVFIRFESVGTVADVYINNKLVGTHKGAYSAFCFEISNSLKYDTINTVLVKVNNDERPDIIPINNKLFGVYGGIYRPASIIVTSKINVTTTDYASPGIYIKQDVSNKKAAVSVTAKIENKEGKVQQITVKTTIRDKSGAIIKQVQQQQNVQPQGLNFVDQQLQINNPHLWNGRKDPYLYSLTTAIIKDGKTIDEVTQPLGLRYFSIVPGKGFYLNGQPYRLYGVCRHQEWQDYGSALSNAQHQSDLAMIYEIGATSIRFAHYQQAEYIYAKCDSMGFVIWAEIPFVNAVSAQEGDNAKQQLTELIRQNYNHPSIYNWGLHNEVYSGSPDGFVPVLTRELNDIAKTEDPGRFTASVSGYGEINRPSNLAADIQGMNRYYGWYEGKIPDLKEWLTGLEKDYPNYKVVLSEYGTEANVNQQQENVGDSGDPSGQFWPETFQTKFHEVQWGIIEKHPYLVASYVWNMFDFSVPSANGGGVPARNMKGLVTYDRKIKKDAFYWYKANWSQEPVLYISGRRNADRIEAVTTVNVFANTSNVTLYLNGKKADEPEMGTTKHDFVFKNIHLIKGVNQLRAEGYFKGKLQSDSIEWTLKN
ncbi:beta-galactosidase [Mucilaginibacter rubeus]|uniref:Beta-galactosidase n=1 Tax=Mucilaginibacter rubeus TaxID=2027860 RepID=A0AAE6JBK9_9SPHI|nr:MULTISPECIES: glycoside hydrolase family 2 TIM barrel-domain containing protein [Mucilaginibacter]QEM02590.1 beta-galactosidase [Mucilaginibacter rubeus]QEM15210.1 beta-galactosidase [Mucilaginibacter gossypii]QTE42066.1 beta-galactosidase [Mucilaginibacter rubeus]QTE48667.1 beta-galactosidase [Mucilaginibacter rubeus]QTE60053.1 beta-galactosidase [Mucilaginibacter rubeus]